MDRQCVRRGDYFNWPGMRYDQGVAISPNVDKFCNLIGALSEEDLDSLDLVEDFFFFFSISAAGASPPEGLLGPAGQRVTQREGPISCQIKAVEKESAPLFYSHSLRMLRPRHKCEECFALNLREPSPDALTSLMSSLLARSSSFSSHPYRKV